MTEAAADALLDEESLASYLAGRRWFGARSRELTGVGVRDTAVVHVAADNAKELDAYFAALFTKL